MLRAGGKGVPQTRGGCWGPKPSLSRAGLSQIFVPHVPVFLLNRRYKKVPERENLWLKTERDFLPLFFFSLCTHLFIYFFFPRAALVRLLADLTLQRKQRKKCNYIFGKQTIITRHNRYNSKWNTAAGVRNNIQAVEMGSAADSAFLNSTNYPYIGFHRIQLQSIGF